MGGPAGKLPLFCISGDGHDKLFDALNGGGCGNAGERGGGFDGSGVVAPNIGRRIWLNEPPGISDVSILGYGLDERGPKPGG